MKTRILLKGRICGIPAALILILLILAQSQGADGMVVLTDEEASSVTGSCSRTWCVLDDNGCWAQVEDCPLGMPNAGRPCQTPCEQPYQDWACDWSIFYSLHGGCNVLDDRDCGSRDTGICNGTETTCQTTDTESCGTATDCENF